MIVQAKFNSLAAAMLIMALSACAPAAKSLYDDGSMPN